MWKLPITAVALLLLSGCVYYYYPEPGSAYAVPATHAHGHRTVSSRPLAHGYPSHAFHSYDYPWASLDYFYFGRGYGYSGFSFGIDYGYSYWPGYDFYGPYRAPYYSFVWLAPYRHHHHHGRYAWFNPYRHHGGYRHQGHYGTPRDDHHSGGQPPGRQSNVWDRDYGRGSRPAAPGAPTQDDRFAPHTSQPPAPGAVSRQVTVSPLSGNRSGMVVRRRPGAKAGPTRIQPVQGAGLNEDPPPAPPSQPAQRGGTLSIVPMPGSYARDPEASRGNPASGVRFASGAKPGATRTQPVNGGSAWVTSMPPRTSAPVARASAPAAAPAIRTTRQGYAPPAAVGAGSPYRSPSTAVVTPSPAGRAYSSPAALPRPAAAVPVKPAGNSGYAQRSGSGVSFRARGRPAGEDAD